MPIKHSRLSWNRHYSSLTSKLCVILFNAHHPLTVITFENPYRLSDLSIMSSLVEVHGIRSIVPSMSPVLV